MQLIGLSLQIKFPSLAIFSYHFRVIALRRAITMSRRAQSITNSGLVAIGLKR
jgi:hypothetical protein